MGVSILARSRDRALLELYVKQKKTDAVSILARSRDRALRRSYCDMREVLPFQSSPGHVTGRCIRFGAAGAAAALVSILARSRDRALLSMRPQLRSFLRCFNPRPVT